MIWASRHFQNANPQNFLRPSNLMRILVPWRAFGDATEKEAGTAVHRPDMFDRVIQALHTLDAERDTEHTPPAK